MQGILPTTLKEPVRELLHQNGDTSPIQSMCKIGGGCINNALHIKTTEQAYFLKWNPRLLPQMFPTEAYGLQLLAATKTVRIPAVYGFSDATIAHPAFIVMEWIDASCAAETIQHGDVQALLGHQLAQMHRIVNHVSWSTVVSQSSAYGLDRNNYIGSTPQYNGWHDDWIAFYREKRLLPQIELAQQQGYMPKHRRKKLEQVMTSLETWLGGVERHPSLLHGDLWGGNVMVGYGGVPVLIDPAVFFGDREADIAFTELFGGFSQQFYQAYQETYALAPGYTERRDLYNLYHLLNHLNLFGESYGHQVDAIAQTYAG